MSNIPSPKKKLKPGQTKALIPLIKKFNAVANVLINSLNQKLEREKRELAHIRVMVDAITIPEDERNHQINITTLDMGKTKIKKKGNMAFNQVMEWEKEMRGKRKGVIL